VRDEAVGSGVAGSVGHPRGGPATAGGRRPESGTERFGGVESI
jgi:hypothetical protein